MEVPEVREYREVLALSPLQSTVMNPSCGASRCMLGMRGTTLIAGVPLGPLRANVIAVETLIGSSAQYDVFGQASAPANAMHDSTRASHKKNLPAIRH